MHVHSVLYHVGIFISPSKRVETLVGSDVTLICQSRVPTVPVMWTISEGPVVTLLSVENVVENSEVCCDAVNVPSYPSEAETTLCITLLAYPCKYFVIIVLSMIVGDSVSFSTCFHSSIATECLLSPTFNS